MLPFVTIRLPALTVKLPTDSNTVNFPVLGNIFPIIVSCIVPACKLPPIPTPPATSRAPNSWLVLTFAPVIARVLTVR